MFDLYIFHSNTIIQMKPSICDFFLFDLASLTIKCLFRDYEICNPASRGLLACKELFAHLSACFVARLKSFVDRVQDVSCPDSPISFSDSQKLTRQRTSEHSR